MCETKNWADANAMIGHDLGDTLSNVIEVLTLVDSVIAPQDNALIDEALHAHGSCLVIRSASDALTYARDYQTTKGETS